MENVQIQMSLVSYDSPLSADQPVVEYDGKFYPRPDEFVYLRTKITNVSRELFPLLCFLVTLNQGLQQRRWYLPWIWKWSLQSTSCMKASSLNFQ